jgi:hypothetical protein
MHRRGHRLDAPHLKARLARMCQAEMYLHCESVFHGSTIRGLHPCIASLRFCCVWAGRGVIGGYPRCVCRRFTVSPLWG